MRPTFPTLSKAIAILWCFTFVVLFFATTSQWQLLNDASLIRYVVFLLSHGFAPYRQVHDINLPGTYLLDYLTLHLLGSGALGLRLYDAILLALAGTAMVVIAPRTQRYAALCAACLFTLFHARDGAIELGQRDLAMAALLLAAIAALTLLLRTQSEPRTRTLALALLFGLATGLASTIKPVCLLFTLLLLPTLPAIAPAKRLYTAFAAANGILLPWIATLLYLAQQHAVHDFILAMTIAVPLHARLGLPGLPYLLRSFLTSSLLVLTALAALAFALLPKPTLAQKIENRLLLTGAAIGALCYLLQLRGYNYHRYPYIGCLLLLTALLIARLLTQPGYLRILGITAAAYALILCPLYAAQARRSTFPTAMDKALLADLQNDGGSPALNHSIQCLDTIDGCLRALNELHLLQSTGTLYDEFLFPPHLPTLLAAQRSQFLAQLQANPPTVLILTPPLFPSQRPDYAKLNAWPAFTTFLDTCYTLQHDRTFPPDARTAPGYRLYHRQPQCIATLPTSSLDPAPIP